MVHTRMIPLCLALALGASGCASLDPRGADGESKRGHHARVILPGEPLANVPVPEEERRPAESAAPAAAEDIWARLRDGFQLPAVTHQRIDQERARFTGRQNYFDAVGQRARPYLYHILGELEARDLPTELVLVAMVESAFQPFAYSHGRAAGLWQFIPATGKHFGLEQNWWYDGRRDVIASTEAALTYLDYLHGFFDGDWLLALAAYNAGEGRVQRAVRANQRAGKATDFWSLNLPAETRAYVPRVLALRDILAEPDRFGIRLPPIDNERQLAVVELEHQLDLALAAEMAGVELDKIYRYNPGFNRWATLPEGRHRLAIPKASKERFTAALADLHPSEMVRWQRHEVRRGETLSGIASRYNTSVSVLRDTNDLSGDRIRVGQALLVPTASQGNEAYTLSADNRRRANQNRQRDGRHKLEHTVRPGDTFWELARRHGVSVRELAGWNDMAPGDPLRPGNTLVIWSGDGAAANARNSGPGERLQRVTYTVRSGDSVYTIARRFNVSMQDVKRWNNLRSGQYLQPGQTLTLNVDVTNQSAGL
ncbi:LysM peptidoglycan-binding domain-containing protein [Alkalilimnicola ehrlichii MLHE-1]|uniref:Lytic transglycosylase, catalytic n=2 Tax=Alkalilimnicola ehrlichii TaxID=351052 RepID=Q0A750_ALKEH|nr:Lytic transglycosylase, catalytic [Alkalilimnicola ehrlichii MLHE-1]